MSKAVDFSFIRYANCWEDADRLIGNTLPVQGARVLSIASAGDNSLAFLAHDPALVLAFDVNETQLFLTELKQKTIQFLAYEEVLVFLGFREGTSREKYFQLVSSHLSAPARLYFENHMHLIKDGIIHKGKFENYFRIFRRYVLPLIHNKKDIDELFREKSASEQLVFYTKTWNNKRWRLLFRLFFSRFVLGRLGRDPAFFNEVGLSVGETIFKSAENHLKTTAVFHNHFLDYQLRGDFSVGLPYYLSPGIFEQVKANIQRLHLFKGYLTDVPSGQAFDIMNLSNIFEYMDNATFRKQGEFLEKIAAPESRIAYWNLLVNRQLPMLSPRFEHGAVKGSDLCFFYQAFHVSHFKP